MSVHAPKCRVCSGLPGDHQGDIKTCILQELTSWHIHLSENNSHPSLQCFLQSRRYAKHLTSIISFCSSDDAIYRAGPVIPVV